MARLKRSTDNRLTTCDWRPLYAARRTMKECAAHHKVSVGGDTGTNLIKPREHDRCYHCCLCRDHWVMDCEYLLRGIPRKAARKLTGFGPNFCNYCSADGHVGLACPLENMMCSSARDIVHDDALRIFEDDGDFCEIGQGKVKELECKVAETRGKTASQALKPSKAPIQLYTVLDDGTTVIKPKDVGFAVENKADWVHEDNDEIEVVKVPTKAKPEATELEDDDEIEVLGTPAKKMLEFVELDDSDDEIEVVEIEKRKLDLIELDDD